MVIPAPARFQFLGADQVLRVVLPQGRILQGSHQARVKTDPVQFFALAELRSVHGSAQFVQKQTVVTEQLIASVAPQRSAAVVPQDQRVVLRRVIARAVVDELRQRLRRAHVGGYVGLCGDPLVFFF